MHFTLVKMLKIECEINPIESIESALWNSAQLQKKKDIRKNMMHQL